MSTYLRKPEWLRIKLDTNANTAEVRRNLRSKGLHTVCEEAACPNLHECWSRHRTATFIILGDTCTRSCRFCAVKTGRPAPPEEDEPQRVAESVQQLEIAHAVITMVNRDDLPDGGASYLAATGKAINALLPEVTVEYLSSDMLGREKDIAVLVESQPEILGHNLETVRRLSPSVRSRSNYDRSLNFLRIARRIDSSILLKSSIMLGLGETMDEILETLQDIRNTGCNLVNIGQYLQPSRQHLPVQKYWRPAEFVEIMRAAQKMGFEHVEAGPMVRSSYHAGGQLNSLLQERRQKSAQKPQTKPAASHQPRSPRKGPKDSAPKPQATSPRRPAV